jgi:hypothetical protein
MNWKFWKKVVPVTEVPITPDNCIHLNTETILIGNLDHVPLKDGHHTSFLLLKCCKCGGMTSFPDENLELALKEGTPEMKQQLRELAELVLAYDSKVPGVIR